MRIALTLKRSGGFWSKFQIAHLCREMNCRIDGQQVDDLDAAVEELKAAGASVLAVREAGGNVPVCLAEVKDPDGNGFELNQSVGLPE